MDSVLEQQRSLHEECERLQLAMVDEIMSAGKTVRGACVSSNTGGVWSVVALPSHAPRSFIMEPHPPHRHQQQKGKVESDHRVKYLMDVSVLEARDVSDFGWCGCGVISPSLPCSA